MTEQPQRAYAGRRGTWAAAAAFVVCAALLTWHAVYYIPFFADDAFISLRYAERFLEGLGLTWTDGERVEGYSNFLWVLLVAFVGLGGQDLVLTARAVGIACGIAMIAAFFWVQRDRSPRVGIAAAVVAGLAMVLSGPVAAHCVGGLEQPLLSALVVWGLACTFPLLDRDAPRVGEVAMPGVLFGLASLTRPDAPLIVASVCAAFVLARGPSRDSLRTASLIACFAAAFYLAQLGFRLGYYGEWIPNTARGKVSLTPKRLASGWKYMREGLWPLSGLLVALVIGLFGAARDRRLGRQLALTLIPAGVWCAFIVSVGGDHVPQHRHLFVAIAMAGLATSLVTAWFLARYPSRQRWTFAVAMLLLVGMAVGTWNDRHRRIAKRNLWYWDGEPVGIFLRNAFERERPLIAVDAAGALPYFSKLPAIDMLGLTDRYIAHHPPESLGRGKLAHELGDGAYVLRREPDLVIFNTARGGARPNWRSGRQMVRDPRFRRDYRLVTFSIENGKRLSSRMWTRLDGAVGVRRTPDAVRIPGYLFSSGKKSRAHQDDDGALFLRVTRKHPGRLAGVTLEPGSWTVELDASGGDPAWEVRGVRRELLASDGGATRFTLDAPTAVTVEVRHREGPPVKLREVVFQRDRGSRDVIP
jgi:hypothetical protein